MFLYTEHLELDAYIIRSMMIVFENLKPKKILNFKSPYFYELGLFIFKFNNNLLPASFNDYFKSV